MRRFRQLYRMRCRYQLFVMVASLFWVHGFLLPSHLRQHEFKTKMESVFYRGRHCVSLRDTRGTSINIISQDNDVGTEFNPSVEESEPTATATAIATAAATPKEHPIRVKKRRKTWNDYFPILKEFYTKHGHSNVTAKDDTDLFKYVTSLRNNYRRQINNDKVSISTKSSSSSKNQQLSDEKLQALQGIDFVWYVPKTKKTWEEYYPRLQKFHRKHGHCNVTPEDDKDLNKYVASLRKNYSPQSITNQSSTISSKSKRRLSDDKLRALTDLDFSWDICPPPRTVRPGGRTWEEYFPRLKEFHDQYGHSNVTSDHDKDLYKYVSSLRKNYRHQDVGNSIKSENGRYKYLPDEKFQALQDLNFSWYDESRTTRTIKLRRRKASKFAPRSITI